MNQPLQRIALDSAHDSINMLKAFLYIAGRKSRESESRPAYLSAESIDLILEAASNPYERALAPASKNLWSFLEGSERLHRHTSG